MDSMDWFTSGQSSIPEADVASRSLNLKIVVLSVIFSVSLAAASFPTVSKRVTYLGIPSVVFFIGKHFGTGVILSTAFVHLLQDSFQILLDPRFKTPIRHWVGLIVLCSLLLIFFVEYVSMTYVERLETEHHHHHLDHHHQHFHDTQSPNPVLPSITAPKSPLVSEHATHGRYTPATSSSVSDSGAHTPSVPSEITHLLSHGPAQNGYGTHPDVQPSRGRTYGPPTRLRAPDNASTTITATQHHTHHRDLSPHSLRSEGEIEAAPFFSGHHRHEIRTSHCHHNAPGRRNRSVVASSEVVVHVDVDAFEDEDSGTLDLTHEPRAVAPKRIEHHDGNGHVHGLPVSDVERNPCRDSVRENSQSERGGTLLDMQRKVVSILVLQMGIMIHSLVIGLTLAITDGPEFASLVTAIFFHQLFEGLSLGIRISSLPSSAPKITVLKPILTFLFAITTPVGIVLGLLLLPRGGEPGSHEQMQLKLTQGVMSAISAGMLIYAACVEMLAADFVMDPVFKRASFGRQALALASLVAGVVGMSLVGL